MTTMISFTDEQQRLLRLAMARHPGLNLAETIESLARAYLGELALPASPESEGLAGFVESCDRRANARVQSSVLYAAYRRYCERQNCRAIRQVQFAGALAPYGVVRRKSNGLHYLVGIGLSGELPGEEIA